MIEIITEEVKMPKLDERRFQKECKNPFTKSEMWFVIDTVYNKPIRKGKFEDITIKCHNLNKKFYRDCKNNNT